MPPERARKPVGKSSKANPSQGSQRFAANAMDLARLLGVSARTIKAWKREEGNPGADGSGRYNIREWQEWAAKNKGTESKEVGPISKQEWEIERIKRQVKAQDIDLEERLGKLIPREQVTAQIHAAVFAFRTELESLPGKLAPQLPGLQIAEIELRLRTSIQEALMKLHRDEWAKQETDA